MKTTLSSTSPAFHPTTNFHSYGHLPAESSSSTSSTISYPTWDKPRFVIHTADVPIGIYSANFSSIVTDQMQEELQIEDLETLGFRPRRKAYPNNITVPLSFSQVEGALQVLNGNLLVPDETIHDFLLFADFLGVRVHIDYRSELISRCCQITLTEPNQWLIKQLKEEKAYSSSPQTPNRWIETNSELKATYTHRHMSSVGYSIEEIGDSVEEIMKYSNNIPPWSQHLDQPRFDLEKEMINLFGEFDLNKRNEYVEKLKCMKVLNENELRSIKGSARNLDSYIKKQRSSWLDVDVSLVETLIKTVEQIENNANTMYANRKASVEYDLEVCNWLLANI